ncbi:MAG: F0F1 ATP synthase subunit B [Candidatus Omnitrophica bacterium]|nr:F0F1 ATP synthase subunit B [Candidatus Omnitrophota bacterium]
MAILKLLSANELVTQIVNFLILLFIMRIFFWKRVLAFLDERKARIEAEFKSAQDAKRSAETLRAEYEKDLKSIEARAIVTMQEAVAQGKKHAEEIVKKAHVEAQTVIEVARSAMHAEVLKEREAIKEDIVNLAMQAMGAVIEEKLTEESDKKIIGEFLDKMDVKK